MYLFSLLNEQLIKFDQTRNWFSEKKKSCLAVQFR